MATYSLYDHGSAPAGVTAITNGVDPAPYILGCYVDCVVGGTVTSLWYYVPDITWTSLTGTIYLFAEAAVSASSNPLTSETFTPRTTAGWQQITLTSPQSFSSGNSFVVGVSRPAGRSYSRVANAFATELNATGLDVPANLGRGVYYDAATPPARFGGTTENWYGVDVTYSTTDPLSANAGADAAKYVGQTLAVSGSGSGGSGTKTYGWTVFSGPAGSFTSASSASTTFTPTGGAGTYTLRLTVTDLTGSAHDDLTLTVSAAPSTTTVATDNVSTGWTATGGTIVSTLADASDSTYITSSTNPSNLILDETLGPIGAPFVGQDFIVRVRCDKQTATTGSIVAKLYDGATLIATATTVTPPNSVGDMDCTFPAANITSMAAGTWLAGVRVTLTVSAS